MPTLHPTKSDSDQGLQLLNLLSTSSATSHTGKEAWELTSAGLREAHPPTRPRFIPAREVGGGREEEVRGYRTGVTWSAKGAGPQRSGRPGRLARNLQRDGSVRACSPDGSGTVKAVTETAVAVTAAAVAAAMTPTHPARTNSLSRLSGPALHEHSQSASAFRSSCPQRSVPLPDWPP